MIEIKSVSKTFKTKKDSFTALNNISLNIEDGDIFGIIGLSGAGKSTLVRCINLLERPTTGNVIIDGKDMTTLSKKELLTMRRNIGMIFQNFNLFSQRTIIKNVCYPMEIAGYSKADALKRAKEMLELVDLTEKENSYPSQLSGGQKQRVAIARALATNPKYLLCDEATSALDPNTTEQILELLKRINKELGITIVVITHEMRVVDKICNKVAVIDNSQIAECGLVSQVFASPKSQIAKELILPKKQSKIGTQAVRIVFNGESTNEPIISALVLECQVQVSIMFADTKDFDGKLFGQMVIRLPEDKRGADKVIEWLLAHNLDFKREEV